MKRKILAVLALAAFIAVGLAGPAAAGDTVTATVTPGLVAVSVTDGSVAYGTVNLSDKKNTVTGDTFGGAAETQTVKNDGTIAANLLLKSSDATATTTWNLVACGSVASEAFGHQFELNNVDTVFTGTDFAASNDAADTSLDLTASATATLDLGICLPTATVDSTEHSITVTALVTVVP